MMKRIHKIWLPCMVISLVSLLLGLVAAPVAYGQPTPAPTNLEIGTEALPPRSQPHIVLAFADDMGRYASAYREAGRPTTNDLIHTPHMDRIAQEGVLFWNAFVSAPSCTPSRAALLSGRHFFRNGSASQLHSPWTPGFADPADQVVTYVHRLRDAGYAIGFSYKLHVDARWMGGRANRHQAAGAQFNAFSNLVMVAEDRDAARAALLQEVRTNFIAFLDSVVDGQPIYYSFHPTNPHRPWAAGSGKALWGIDPDALQGAMPGFLPDVPEIRQDFADYLGECMAFDASVGVLMAVLEERGMSEDTLFVVTGDHGAPGFPRGKCNLYDFGTQVPLMVRWPSQIPTGDDATTRVIRQPVSLIDLGPTFAEAAGTRMPDDVDGTSVLSMLTTTDETVSHPDAVYLGRETHVNEARPGGLPYPCRAIRTAEYLLVINFKPDRWPVAPLPLGLEGRVDFDQGPTRQYFVARAQTIDDELAESWRLGFERRPAIELYDVRNDPDQMRNLAGQPEYATQQAILYERLMGELTRAGDPRVVGAGDGFDRPPYLVAPE